VTDVLSATAIRKAFGAIAVLQDVSLTLRAGEVHAVVGENGAGKSTLIRILTGALRPDGGAVTLAGAPLSPDPRLVRRRGISCVYQEFTLVPDMTVRDNILLGREPGPLRPGDAGQDRIAARLRELGARCSPDAVVRTLSVAEQQLVEIARALDTNARVLILDEPTAALSGPEVERLLALVRELRHRGLGIIYVSHRFDEIFAIADRVTVLRDGRCVATADRAGLSRDQLIRWMVGRELREEFPDRTARPGAPVLEVEHLSAPGRFEDVSFIVRAGEILGLGGLVGAGRTSVGLAVAGALHAEGTVRLNGRIVKRDSPADAIAEGIAYLTEDRKRRGILPQMSVLANLTVTYLGRFTRAGLIDGRREREGAGRIAGEVQVRGVSLDQPARTLSGGTQQKVLLGRFLLEPRRVVILDEPTRGVDVGARAEIYAQMNRLTEQGVGIVMISSDLPELLGMSDRVLIMRDGRVAGALERGEATPERVMGLAAGA
jgi:ABC-type sugar transport system ATPase subunit